MKKTGTEFENFGYATDEPCEVCGKEGDNRQEPRFLYTVCENHYHLSPIEVSNLRALKRERNEV